MGTLSSVESRRSSAAESPGSPARIICERAGVESVVFDPTPGGLIGTVHVEGCILETGPESWLASKPWAEQLVRELGMGDQLVGFQRRPAPHVCLRDGHFVTLPEGLQLVVPTRLSRY